MSYAAAMTSGTVIPESVLHHPEFAILAAFVAVNTLMYGALAFAKILPKVYVSDLRHLKRLRSETRSIHPDAPSPATSPTDGPEVAPPATR